MGTTDKDVNLDTNINQSVDPDEVKEINKGLAEPPATAKPAAKPVAGEPAKTKVEKGEDDDLDEDEDAPSKADTELEGAETDEDRETIREHRRQERKERRTRGREKQQALERQIQALITQNRQLAEQVSVIQDSSTGAQLAQVETLIQQATQAADHFKNIVADATTKGDGRTAAEATVAMMDARNRANQLTAYKQNTTRLGSAPKPLNPLMVSHAQSFLSEHKWYGGPQSQDPDSRVLSAVDNSLAAEGWDPTTPNYWTELKVRASKYLPHRFSAANLNGAKDDPDDEPVREVRSPVSGKGGDSVNKGSSVTFGLSAERVKAMKDAGAWEDPKRRNAMIQKYRQYDIDNKLH